MLLSKNTFGYKLFQFNIAIEYQLDDSTITNRTQFYGEFSFKIYYKAFSNSPPAVELVLQTRKDLAI